MKRELISFEWAIQKLLDDKTNFNLMAGFLSELLLTDITIIEVFENEQTNRHHWTNVKVRDTDGQILLIEIQYSRTFLYFAEILVESPKRILTNLTTPNAFIGVTKVVCISLLYFDFFQSKDCLYHGTSEYVGKQTDDKLKLTPSQKRLFDTQKIGELAPVHYIINVNQFNAVVTDTLDEWLYYLKHDEVKPGFTAKGLSEVREKLAIYKLSDVQYDAYDLHLHGLHRQASLFETYYAIPRRKGKEEKKKSDTEAEV